MGGGKSKWLCEEVKELAMQYPGNRIVIGRQHLVDFKNSTLKTLLEVLGDELIADHNKAEGRIILYGGSEILYMGFSEEENISKLKSMEIGAFALDEASEIYKETFLLFHSRLRRILPDGSRPPYFGLLATNPEDCWLKDYFLKGEVERHTFTDDKELERHCDCIVTEDNVFIPSLPCDNPYLPEDYETQLEKTFPGDWINRYLRGSWDDLTGDNKIIPRDWVDAAINREIPRVDKRIISVDVARYGGDEIVIDYGLGNSLVEQDISKRKGLMETVGRIINMSKKYNAHRVLVDDIGMGGGVTDRLREMKEKVTPIIANARSLDDKFFNLKTEMWWYARQLFENGKVRIIDDPVLIRQISTVQYKVRDSNGTLVTEPKDDVKKRIGQSPDRADAFIMLLWGAKSMRDPAGDYRRQFDPQQNSEQTSNSYGWDNTKVGV